MATGMLLALPRPLSGALASSAQACQPLPRGEPRSQESCSGAGQLRGHTCHVLAQALGTGQPGLLSFWSKRQVLGCKLAELALGGVNKKEIVLEACQGLTKSLEGCLTRLRNGQPLRWSWRIRQGGQPLVSSRSCLASTLHYCCMGLSRPQPDTLYGHCHCMTLLSCAPHL